MNGTLYWNSLPVYKLPKRLLSGVTAIIPVNNANKCIGLPSQSWTEIFPWATAAFFIWAEESFLFITQEEFTTHHRPRVMGSRDHGLKSLKLLAKWTFSLCKWVFLDGLWQQQDVAWHCAPHHHQKENEWKEEASARQEGWWGQGHLRTRSSYHTVFNSHSRTHFTYGNIKSWKHGGEGWWKK